MESSPIKHDDFPASHVSFQRFCRRFHFPSSTRKVLIGELPETDALAFKPAALSWRDADNKALGWMGPQDLVQWLKTGVNHKPRKDELVPLPNGRRSFCTGGYYITILSN